MSWAVIVLGALMVFALGWVAGRSYGGRDLSGPRPLAGPTRAFDQLGPSIRAEIETAIASGHKIDAIKLLREATGMGLQESKEAVESMERR
ncbi:Ribosomal protein L7/L12 C-terminal domain-containing protein [Novosphingobium sp. CF614]|uniref:ribosomal protein L7/L12 n=1 Tax=Novosphingobium sp. CF614 TaxID=1884364 RepID=UPI0008DF1FFE|nr:ribosomal protein L7/L12 [Novosphingobium sp. CF614]SFF76708.1 Ribosomal protein L7/L12 C-terminal domain-containing protein [Novosphingobium sp. CF614]